MRDISKLNLVSENGEIIGQEKLKIKINNPENDRPITIFLIIVACLGVVSIISLNLNYFRLFTRLTNLGGVFVQLAMFNFTNFDFIWSAFLESLTVTILATIYSIFTGLVMASFMAKNIAPSRILSSFLYSFNSFIRAVPTPVWVLIFIACLGFGPAPGIVGLSFHATAFFARAFSQAFEEIPYATVESLQATGANRLQIYFSAIFPAALTSLIAWSAMRFEINFAESAILGMVGGGGIGYAVSAFISGYDFGSAGLSIFLVFVFLLILELTFAMIKKRMKV